jgi:hypothetical protein
LENYLVVEDVADIKGLVIKGQTTETGKTLQKQREAK